MESEHSTQERVVGHFMYTITPADEAFYRRVAGETVQQLAELATLSEDWSSVPYIHVPQHTTTCDCKHRHTQT